MQNLLEGNKLVSPRIWLFRISIIVLLLFGISITRWATVDAAATDLTLTPTPDVERSWFADDTCSLPCWMGLIPGQSTSQEVAAFIQAADPTMFWRWEPARNSEFDPATGYMIDGGYYFYWQEFFRPDNSYQLGSVFNIENSTLLFINVEVNEFISPRQVIDALGQPDRVGFTLGLYNDPEIILNFPDLSLRIRISGEAEDCTLVDMADRFWVHQILYYAPSYSNSYLDKIYDVPLHLWNDWLDGKANTFCYEAADQLWATRATQTAMPLNTPIPVVTPTQ